MCYVYRKTMEGMWVVGFFLPRYNDAAAWFAESEWKDQEDAAARVHYLNGGN